MLAMHSSMNRDKCASLLPFIQLAYNSSTMHETPFFLMYVWSEATTTVDSILGIPHVGTTEKVPKNYLKPRRKIYRQVAFQLARRNLSERTQKQAAKNAKLRPIPAFKPGDLRLVYRPYHQDSDCPNPEIAVAVACTIRHLLPTIPWYVESEMPPVNRWW